MDMTKRVEFAVELMKKLNFPSDAIGFFKLIESGYWLSGPYAEELQKMQADYMTGAIEKQPALERLVAIGAEAQIPHRSLHEVFYLNAAAELYEKYQERGIDEQIFYDSMSDLKWKLMECRELRGVWGNDTFGWSHGFFIMDRYALGRLQFEEREHNNDDYTFNGVTLKKGDPVLNMHIPSAGPFPRELRYASYRKAYDFYPNIRVGGKYLPIRCSSWLLNPDHDTYLDPNSNIVDFLHDFDVFESGWDELPGDLWRVLGHYITKPVDELPTDTSLRRNYVRLMKEVGKAGWGRGLILFDGEKIVNNKRGE